MKITRRQLRNLIRESIDREKLVRYIAGELSNRAYDLDLLDDINNLDPNALDYTLPEVLVSKLGPDLSQERWSGLAKAIAKGDLDYMLYDIVEPEEEADLINEDVFSGLGTSRVAEVADILTRLSEVAADNSDLAIGFGSAMASAAAECGRKALFGGQSFEQCIEEKAGEWLSENWSSLLSLLARNPGLMSDMARLQKIASEMGITLTMPG